MVEARYKDDAKATIAWLLRQDQVCNVAPHSSQVKGRCEGRIRGARQWNFQVGRP